MTPDVAILYIKSLIEKAEDDASHYDGQLLAYPDSPDYQAVRERIIFHHGQVSGLRHALFALTTTVEEPNA